MVYIWCIYMYINMAMQVYTGCMPVVSYEAVSHMILRITYVVQRCRGARWRPGASQENHYNISYKPIYVPVSEDILQRR